MPKSFLCDSCPDSCSNGCCSATNSCLTSGLSTFFRLKKIDYANVSETRLRRCLGTLDLAALGIGSTLGAGIYIVAGQVAKEHSGPSVVLSFLIAAIASIFAGVCYAEFGARVPKTGSAYLYTYITVGELMAFVIGWNLTLEYMIGTASVASACSTYFDSLIDNRMAEFFNSNMHMDINFLGTYPDFLAFGLTVVLAVLLACGVKESTMFNNVFTGLNLLNILVAVVAGSFKANPANWELPPHNYTDRQTGEMVTDNGGFMPYGFSEMLAGASTCFYAFVGFDIIATTGEEVKNPQKAIPISIIISLLACCAAYCSVSTVLTLMVPYYELDGSAALPMAFEQVGFLAIRWVISIGAIAGLSASLLGAMFPLPRILYAMASDGLIFRSIAEVSDRFKTPFLATILSGFFAALMALLFDLDQLVDMMSIGTLLAYTLVACSVLLLRYRMDEQSEDDQSCQVQSDIYEGLFDLRGRPRRRPTEKSQLVTTYATCFIGLFALMMGIAVLVVDLCPPAQGVWFVFAVGVAGVIGAVIVIYQQPQSQQTCTFKVPFLPVVAALSISVNIVLMFKLSLATWIRFGIWMAAGFGIYFGYGVWHSSERVATCNSTESSHLLPSQTATTKKEGDSQF